MVFSARRHVSFYYPDISVHRLKTITHSFPVYSVSKSGGHEWSDAEAVLAQSITPAVLSTPDESENYGAYPCPEERGFAPGSRNPVTDEGTAFDGVAPAKRDGMYRSSRLGRASFR